MYYCFLSEDINGLVNDPLIIQKAYAQRLNSLCIGSLTRQTILNDSNSEISIAGKKVLLRCTYDNLISGLHLLSEHGADLIETEHDVNAIESWYKLGLTSRALYEVELMELLAGTLNYIDTSDKIFLKSKHKGFSAVISTAKILQQNTRVVAFLEKQSKKYGSSMVLSEYIPIKNDSLGTRETRHIILDNKVTSSSRPLHSIKHTIPKSHRIKAQQIADQIKKADIFPSNYTLDLGEFIDENYNSLIDIVEINPLSCSMCYVNNSIYTIPIPEIYGCQKELMMGFEFCYDAIINPQNYSTERETNKNYNYIADNHFSFI